jgi:broad specificity phosphatase PhoE
MEPTQEPIADGRFFHELTAATEFVLLRHGESEGNKAGIFQGRKEYPLSAEGRAQALSRGRLLSRPHPFAAAAETLVFCSPLGRARETADLIAREAGFSAPEVMDELIELDTGVWTGKSWEEVRREDPVFWNKFRSESWAALDSAESCGALYARAMSAWGLLRDRAVGREVPRTASGQTGAQRTDSQRIVPRRIVAVSHGGFLQWLIRSTFGCRTWFPLVPVHNCGASVLKVEPAGPESAYIAWDSLDERLD